MVGRRDGIRRRGRPPERRGVMTKADLIDEVSRLAELTRKDSEVIVETIFDSVVRSLRAGDKIEIRGFGSPDSGKSRAANDFSTSYGISLLPPQQCCTRCHSAPNVWNRNVLRAPGRSGFPLKVAVPSLYPSTTYFHPNRIPPVNWIR